MRPECPSVPCRTRDTAQRPCCRGGTESDSPISALPAHPSSSKGIVFLLSRLSLGTSFLPGLACHTTPREWLIRKGQKANLGRIWMCDVLRSSVPKCSPQGWLVCTRKQTLTKSPMRVPYNNGFLLQPMPSQPISPVTLIPALVFNWGVKEP